MPDRFVHEILFSKKTRRPYGAFIQHGRREDGYKYEFICPYCTQTVGELQEAKDDLGVVFLEPSEVASELRKLMESHLFLCNASGFHIRVKKTNVPLGVENPPKVM